MVIFEYCLVGLDAFGGRIQRFSIIKIPKMCIAGPYMIFRGILSIQQVFLVILCILIIGNDYDM